MTRGARRTFTPDFKTKAVLAVLAGTASQAEASRKHQIGPSLSAPRKATLLDRLPVVFRADEAHSDEAARVGELERLVGQQALELAARKKASTWRGGATTSGGGS